MTDVYNNGETVLGETFFASFELAGWLRDYQTSVNNNDLGLYVKKEEKT